jgi:hypothetical protein
VGWLDRLKSFAAPARDADAAMPRWARITRIDRGPGPIATVEMEIHYGDAPPFTYSDLLHVPTGTIWVGQDVAVQRHRAGQHSSAGSADVYEIRYGEPPHYGLPRRAKTARPGTDPTQS